MHLSTMSEWLDWIASIHFSTIDLGLDRITKVANALQLLPVKPKVIVVGGTNGKGSTVAALEAIYRQGSYAVGCFTSPILFKHNEQVRINGLMPSDRDFCAVYEQIESVRDTVTLTPFEYHTLAGLLLFQQQVLDLLVLEVGMGGRLDAVNIVDADISIVTSIAIDHAQWLGNTREAIAVEKAGIFRANHPCVCGDSNPPLSLIAKAKELNAQLYQQGKDFRYSLREKSWDWHSEKNNLLGLPYNSLLIENMSTALMAVELLQTELPIDDETLRQGLATTFLPGRIQVIDGPIKHIFDVSHNPAAIALLAKHIKKMPKHGKSLAIFSMLADKDIEESVKQIKDVIDEWYIAPVIAPRAASSDVINNALQKADVLAVYTHKNIRAAYEAAYATAKSGDLIIVFGSFHTVAEAW